MDVRCPLAGAIADSWQESLYPMRVFLPLRAGYANYFRELPAILRQFDHLIFYASEYRDIRFARQHGLTDFSIIPNGASEVEFSITPDPSFRHRYGCATMTFSS